MRVRAAAAVLVQNERVLGDVELDQYCNSIQKKICPSERNHTLQWNAKNRNTKKYLQMALFLHKFFIIWKIMGQKLFAIDNDSYILHIYHMLCIGLWFLTYVWVFDTPEICCKFEKN